MAKVIFQNRFGREVIIILIGDSSRNKARPGIRVSNHLAPVWPEGIRGGRRYSVLNPAVLD